MPSLLAEDALHGTRKPCSRTLKALFLHQARPFDEKRGAWQLKYLDNPYWMFSVLLIQRVRSISHRKTQMSRTHRAHRERFALPRSLPFTPPCPAVQTSETLPRSPLPLHATSLPCREKSLHIIKLTTTRQAKIIIYNQAYNPQEIS